MLALLLGALATPLAASETGSAARSPVTAPPAVHPEDPLRFTMDGETWFAVGYYPALGTFSSRDAVASRYYAEFLDRLAAAKVNYARMVFSMGQGAVDASFPYLRSGEGLAADGQPRFDLGSFNETHFTYWREVLAYAQARGIVVQLVLFDAWHNRHWRVGEDGGEGEPEWGMKHDFYNGANNVNGVDAGAFPAWIRGRGPVFEAQAALAEKIVDELGSFPNIIWEIGNEATIAGGAAADAWQNAIAAIVTAREAERGYPRHLVMPRDLPNHERIAHDRPGMLGNRGHARPLLIDNDVGLEVWTPEFRRQKAWAALTSGAHISFFHFPMEDRQVLRSEDVALGLRYVGNTGRFVELAGIDLAGMAPCDARVSRGWCYGRPGGEAIVYLPEGGEVTVADLPAGATAEWFDPRAGTLAPAGAGPSFTPPGAGDWALYVRAPG